MLQKKSDSINLLKRETPFVDRFINWALTIGRLLVIVTEIVALGAFVYRFSLDRQIIDLHSKINQEQAIVNYLKDNEANYRNLQGRLVLAATSSTLATNRLKIFNDMVKAAPTGLAFNTLSLYEDRIRIEANVDSVASLTKFVNAIKDYPAIDTISIDKIESKPSSAVITINLTATLKPNYVYAGPKQ